MSGTRRHDAESSVVLVINDDYTVSQLTVEELTEMGGWFTDQTTAIDYRAFSDSVLATCWASGQQPRSGEDVRAMPKRVRQRMLRDVVEVNGLLESWRALHGSGMTLDQRLYQVFRERWQRHRDFAARIAKRSAELEQARAFDGPIRATAAVR